MALVFDHQITNDSDVEAGPFDLTDIFGPGKRDADIVSVPPKQTLQFKAEMVEPQETVQRKFSVRLGQLGLPANLVYVISLCIPDPPPEKPRHHPQHVRPRPNNEPTGAVDPIVESDEPDTTSPASVLPSGS